MKSGLACTVCRTKMVLIDRQPVDGEYETHFFKCGLCGSAAQLIVETESIRNQPDDK